MAVDQVRSISLVVPPTEPFDTLRLVEINKYEITLGRNDLSATSNDVNIQNQSVSRRHAVISNTPCHTYITDTGSRYGTTINGEPLKSWRPTKLTAGDVIKLGNAQPITFKGAKNVSESTRILAQLANAQAETKFSLVKELPSIKNLGMVCGATLKHPQYVQNLFS